MDAGPGGLLQKRALRKLVDHEVRHRLEAADPGHRLAIELAVVEDQDARLVVKPTSAVSMDKRLVPGHPTVAKVALEGVSKSYDDILVVRDIHLRSRR